MTQPAKTAESTRTDSVPTDHAAEDLTGPGPADTENADPSGRKGATLTRATAIGLALLPITLLFVARGLEPSSAGLGTHQQLGLPPCSTRMLFGIRCPGCGMTTSWAYFTRGQWIASANVNVGGFLLAIYSLAFVVLAIDVGRTGRFPSFSTQRIFGITLIAVFAITITDWIWRLTLGS